MKNAKKQKELPDWAFYEPEWCELKSEVTGLPVSVWVDVSGYKNRKSLNYIRFAPFIGDKEWDYNELHGSRPMFVSNQPYVPKEYMKVLDKKVLLPLMKKWVAKYEKLIKAVGYGKISSIDFEKELSKSKELWISAWQSNSNSPA
jgi:hypothetical protein